MNWRAVWRLSGPLYAEIAFQAIYALNLGNLPPTGAAGTLSIVARRRVTQSKLLVAAILALVSVGGFVALAARTEGLLAPGLDRGLYASAVIGAVYVLELALLWWTGLQVLPAYLASSAVRFLETLPLDERTLSRVALVLVGRLFDLPALACLVATPLVVGVGLGSVAAGVAALFGGVVVLVLAIALALRTGDFFVRRIQGAHAGHRQTAIRWGYLVLWAVPAFAMYGVIALGPDVLKFLGDAQAAGGERLGLTLAVFPLPLGALPALLGTGSPVLGSADAAIALALVAYGLLAVAAAQWLAGAPRALARTIPSGTVPETVRA
ncbi:MAG TPA: hypothetical protein VLX64_05230, partial [Thermoplasmata archaeon]|nr:hypothetical protein [Thermoplasmata archaeon]